MYTKETKSLRQNPHYNFCVILKTNQMKYQAISFLVSTPFRTWCKNNKNRFQWNNSSYYMPWYDVQLIKKLGSNVYAYVESFCLCVFVTFFCHNFERIAHLFKSSCVLCLVFLFFFSFFCFELLFGWFRSDFQWFDKIEKWSDFPKNPNEILAQGFMNWKLGFSR